MNYTNIQPCNCPQITDRNSCDDSTVVICEYGGSVKIQRAFMSSVAVAIACFDRHMQEVSCDHMF